MGGSIRVNGDTLGGEDVDLVRLGAEGVISEPLIPYHAGSIQERSRTLFSAEFCERVIALAVDLLLPQEFVHEYMQIYIELEVLSENISRLEAQISDLEGVEQTRTTATVTSMSAHFWGIVEKRYGVTPGKGREEALAKIHKDLRNLYEIHSDREVKKLKSIVRLAEGWRASLCLTGNRFEEFLVKSRNVVAGTCVGIGHHSYRIAGARFDWVIVDEAARAGAGDLCVAIQSSARVLLVGDHNQLPPHSDRYHVEAVRTALDLPPSWRGGTSEFERLYDSGFGHKFGEKLTDQYRMAPAICEMVSDLFYDGDLNTIRSEAWKSLKLVDERIVADVIWADTSKANRKAFHLKVKESNSIENRYEAEVIINLLDCLAIAQEFRDQIDSELESTESAIGVICMYAAQRDLLIERIARHAFDENFRQRISVGTVDGYQGKENRVIILSLTRNRPGASLGFVPEPKRLNVSLSRAMDKLVIVGSREMWSRNVSENSLKPVLDYIDNKRDTDARYSEIVV